MFTSVPAEERIPIPFPSCLPPGDLPDSGIELSSVMSPAPASGFFTTGNGGLNVSS